MRSTALELRNRGDAEVRCRAVYGSDLAIERRVPARDTIVIDDFLRGATGATTARVTCDGDVAVATWIALADETLVFTPTSRMTSAAPVVAVTSTTGESSNVTLTLLDANGKSVGTSSFPLSPHAHRTVDLRTVRGVARVEAAATGGTIALAEGRVVASHTAVATDDLDEITFRVHLTDEVSAGSVATGLILRSVDASGSVLASAAGTRQLDPADRRTIVWTLNAVEWYALFTGATAAIEIGATNTLRAAAWGDVPVQREILLRIPRAQIESWILATPPGGTTTQTVYQLDDLYAVASTESRTGVASFKAAPFAEPRTGLTFFRNRWYDASTGTFLTPDLAGYRDSSSLYAYCAADPVNCSDATGLAASMSRSGWILATNNADRGRVHRFSPSDIAADPRAVRAFLGINAAVDPRAADTMLERAGRGSAIGSDVVSSLAPGIARSAGVYPLMVTTAGAALGGGAGSILSTELGLGFVGTTMLPGFTGGLGGQAGSDLYARRISGAEQYLTTASVSAITSLAIGTVVVGGQRLVWGRAGTPSLAGSLPNDWYIPDNAYVRFDASRFDSSIAEFGIQTRFFKDAGKVWLTRYGYIRQIENAKDLETVLYRQNLWPTMEGRFETGATLRIVRNVEDAVLAGVTNKVDGVPQWRVIRDVPPSDLTIIRRLPYAP